MVNVHSFKAKNRRFEFEYWKMNTFESVRCSKNDVWVCSISNSANLVICSTMFNVCLFEAKKGFLSSIAKKINTFFWKNLLPFSSLNVCRTLDKNQSEPIYLHTILHRAFVVDKLRYYHLSLFIGGDLQWIDDIAIRLPVVKPEKRRTSWDEPY